MQLQEKVIISLPAFALSGCWFFCRVVSELGILIAESTQLFSCWIRLASCWIWNSVPHVACLCMSADWCAQIWIYMIRFVLAKIPWKKSFLENLNRYMTRAVGLIPSLSFFLANVERSLSTSPAWSQKHREIKCGLLESIVLWQWL